MFFTSNSRYLEYHLCRTFASSHDEDVKILWCDGVSCLTVTDNQQTLENIIKTGEITTRAWIGRNGQDEYQMTIVFGKRSKASYQKGEALNACIPPENKNDWYEIDSQKKTIKIQLL